jgi:hypothetical protein
MREHLPCWKEGSDSDLLAWLSWHWNIGLVAAMLIPESERIGCLLVVRYLNDPAEFEQTYVHHHGGKICVAELLIVTEPEALGAAIELLIHRCGRPLWLMHSRSKWEPESKPKLVHWSSFERHLRRQIYAPA